MSGGRQDLAALSEGQAVDEVYLLARKQVFTTKGGKPYGALRLADQSGEVEAKLWEQAEELLGPVAPGMAVRVAGRVQVYNGQTQLVLTALCAQPQVDPSQFLPASPHTAAELWERLETTRAGVREPHIKRLLKVFFEDPEFRRAFERAPAAKAAHHAYVRGLLEHTASVAGLALLVAGHYPHLDRDLLLAGALLHDIGKTEELVLGPPLDYSDAGRLEGHVVLGVRMLDARLTRLKGFPPALAGQLRHMLISHHGTEEFGSPQKPKTAEALALHQVDDLDAKTAMVREAIAAGNGEARWSSFHRLLERHIYTGPIAWDQDAPQPADEPERAAQPTACLPGLFDRAPGGQGEG